MKFNDLQRALAHTKPTQITTLDLSNQHLTELPDEIGRFSNLRVLTLYGNQLTRLPYPIGELTNLTTLNAGMNQLTQLPDSMRQLRNLITLDLCRNQLTELPDVFDAMPNLRTINLSRNQLRSFPVSFQFLTGLSNLDTRYNGFTSVPSVLFRFDNLRDVKGFGSTGTVSIPDILLSFGRAYTRAELPEYERFQFQELLTNPDDATQTMPIRQLFDALLISHPTTQQNVLEGLRARSANQPLREGAALAVVGNTVLNRTELKEKLSRYGIRHQTAIDTKTTHVLVGGNPKKYEAVAHLKICIFLIDSDLTDFFNTQETPFLLDTDEHTAGQQANLAQLLAGPDTDAMAVGIEIIKTGGLPTELFTEVYFVSQLADQKKVRDEAARLLKQTGPSEFAQLLARREQLFKQGEKETFKAIQKYATLFPELIDWARFAWLLYRKKGVGLRYIFETQPPHHPLRISALDSLIDGTKLNVSQAFTKSGGLPDLNFPYSYPYYKPRPFLADVLQYTHLTDLSMAGVCISSVPNEISQLQQLTTLKLNTNFLHDLPEGLAQLTKLRTLDISDNEFVRFPAVLLKMPWLHTINITRNRQQYTSFSLPAMPNIRDFLPNTEIIGLAR